MGNWKLNYKLFFYWLKYVEYRPVLISHLVMSRSASAYLLVSFSPVVLENALVYLVLRHTSLS